MKIEFKASFKKDLKRIKQFELFAKIKNVIEEINQAETIFELSNIQKLTTGKSHYRIRIGNYRIGIQLKENVVVFVRVLHRKEIYKYFP